MLNFAPVRVNVTDYLFGNILGLSNADLWTMYIISIITVPTLVALRRPLLLMMFEPSVAASQGVPVSGLRYFLMAILVLAMISSLQAVGVVLALGMLIAPAATLYLVTDSFTVIFWAAGVLGAFGSCLGLWLSYIFNLPSGACIVLVLGCFFMLAYLLSPRYGLITKFLKRQHLHEESLARWRRPADTGEGSERHRA
jgi:ABC-type Mn2+/Zn2+ transport system permease subunit